MFPQRQMKQKEKRISSVNRTLETYEEILNNKNNSQKALEFIQKSYDNLIEEKSRVRDSGPRYIELANSLTKNKVYINYCQKMVPSELLDFITQNISAPMPAKIDQDLFGDMVEVGIKEDKR